MKFEKLEIVNFRGIRRMEIELKAKNHLIVGANGVGKSSIVDAIDFLITGTVWRMRGDAHGDVRPDVHYAHLGSAPEDVFVRANIILDGKSLEIKRCLANPDEMTGTASVEQKKRIAQFASLQQHIITRKDVLRFIAVKPASRAEWIQKLLEWSVVEERRRRLVSIESVHAKQLKIDEISLKDTFKGIAARLEMRTYKEKDVLIHINKMRASIGLLAATELNSTSVFQGLAKSEISEPALRAREFLRRRNLLTALPEDKKSNISMILSAIRKEVESFPAEPERVLSIRQLVLSGIKELKGRHECPLCDTEWEPGKLEEHLRTKLASSNDIDARVGRIQLLLIEMKALISEINETISQALELAREYDMAKHFPVIDEACEALKKFTVFEIINAQGYISTYIDANCVDTILAASNLQAAFDELHLKMEETFGAGSPTDKAREALLWLASHFSLAESLVNKVYLSKGRLAKVTLLLSLYIAARDAAQENIYSKITKRCDQLYIALHKGHSSSFESTLEPDDAGLEFLVKFHNNESYPPHIVHSEGHQDSMGLCLFFALGEHLTKGESNFLVIDDVVTSIDAAHRRALADMLFDELGDRQLIIATHDHTWSEQLKKRGIVSSNGGVTSIKDWEFVSGPMLNASPDIWDVITKQVDDNKTAEAASSLRRALEEFMAHQCDMLGTPVRYSLHGRLTLSDWLGPAINDLKKTLRKASLRIARDPNARATADWLEARIAAIEDAEKNCNLENWLLNPSVHFDPLVDCHPNDLRPVIAADRALTQAMQCPECSGLFGRPMQGGEISCGCKKFVYV